MARYATALLLAGGLLMLALALGWWPWTGPDALPGGTGANAGALPAERPAPPERFFVDHTPRSGVSVISHSGGERIRHTLEATGTGCGVLDYDGDGWLDIYVVNGGESEIVDRQVVFVAHYPDSLYRNKGDGSFEDVTDRAGLRDDSWGQGMAVADYDNDGDQDIYVTNYGPNLLYRNEGNGTFTECAAASGLTCPQWSTSASWLDADKDGDLDLFVGNFVEFNVWDPPLHQKDGLDCTVLGVETPCGPGHHAAEASLLFRNDGDGTFTDVTVEAGDLLKVYGRALGTVVLDVDKDGWDDIYVANDFGHNYLYRNLGGLRFEEVARRIGGVGEQQSEGLNGSMGVDAADIDGDGFPELFITNAIPEINTLFHNVAGRLLMDETTPRGLGNGLSYYDVGWGTKFMDLDMDGLLDLLYINGNFVPDMDAIPGAGFAQPGRICLGQPDGTFRYTPMPDDAVYRARRGRGLAVGDLNRDGLPDLVVSNISRPLELLYAVETPGRHLSVDVQATRSHPQALGARLELTAGGRRSVRWVRSDGSYLAANETTVHFGLGELDRADSLEVHWPSGAVETVQDLAAGMRYRIREGQGVVDTDPLAVP